MPGSQSTKKRAVRLQSLAHALRGVDHLVRTRPRARVHLLAALLVLAVGLYVRLSGAEWLWITVAIALVWSAAALSVAFELLADILHPRRHPGIGRAKDVASAAVLIAVVGAAIVGVLVFLPYFAGVGR